MSKKFQNKNRNLKIKRLSLLVKTEFIRSQAKILYLL